LVEVILGGAGHVQFVGQGGSVPEPGSGEFGAGMEQAFGDHGDYQVSLGAGFGGEQSIEAEAADGAEDGLDVAVGEGAVDVEGVAGGEELLAGEGAADEINEVRGEMGDVAEGFVLDLRADAEGAAEEVGQIGLALVNSSCGGHVDFAGS
jgi:hypothetical protein